MSLNFKINILKQFDGKYNYFNPSHCNGKTIFRREFKYENKVLVSDIIDNLNNVILAHYTDENFLYCYEDARFINENEISVCVCRRNKENLTEILEVSYKKYNLLTKEFTHYKTQKSHFEKHWQFYDDKIIYHVNPYTVMDKNENILFTSDIDWNPWIEKYGKPGLSTNIFEIENKKYLLFHSYISLDTLYFKYYIGILKLDDNLNAIDYIKDPLFESNKSYSDSKLLESLWEWRNTKLASVVKYEVIFPMTTIVTNDQICIYSGLNDCSAVILKINKLLFTEYITNNT
jgi:hypothetical protein